MATVALVGTLDTKGPDYAFLAERLRAAGAGVIVVDAGTGTPQASRRTSPRSRWPPRPGRPSRRCARPGTGARP